MKYDLTEQEITHVPYTSQEFFAVNLKREQILFAKFRTKAIYSREVGYMWKYKDGRETVNKSHLKASFIDYRLVNNLNYPAGIAEFQEKEIKYDTRNHY